MDEIFIRPLAEIDINIDIEIENNLSTRYITPPQLYEIPEQYLKYQRAEKLAKDLVIRKGTRHFVFIDGKFIFGDFIEALIVNNNYHVEELTISTLSMSQNNIDSLQNLITGNYVDKLNLIVSDYFFSHERNQLIKYAYQELDIDNKFQLAVAASHCKIATIKTHNGGFIIIHGSANMRSSSNIEQIVVEESENLFNFVDELNQSILEKYQTINKSIRHSKLWNLIKENKKPESWQAEVTNTKPTTKE